MAGPAATVRAGVQELPTAPVLGAVAGAYGNNLAREQVMNIVGGGEMAILAVDAAMLIVGVGLAMRGSGAVRGVGWGITAMSGKNVVSDLMAQFGGAS